MHYGIGWVKKVDYAVLYVQTPVFQIKSGSGGQIGDLI